MTKISKTEIEKCIFIVRKQKVMLDIEYDLKKPFQNLVNLNENKKWWPENDLPSYFSKHTDSF